jgi:hypothetical protein
MKVVGLIPDEVIGFFQLSYSSSHTMVLGSIMPLTEMRTRNFPGGEEWQVRKTDNLTMICEVNV